MAIITSPPAIIFINNDLSSQVLSVFVRQLFITEVLTAAQFDGYVAMDGYWPAEQIADGYRILVLRDLWDQTNRNDADIVLFAKSGLVSVLCNKIGPPDITLPINQVYLTALIELKKCYTRCCFCHHCYRCNYYDLFVGLKRTRDYNPYHLDPPCIRNVEPNT
jgi:hypothetical protein